METAFNTGSIIPLSGEITVILYGLSHKGTRSCFQIFCWKKVKRSVRDKQIYAMELGGGGGGGGGPIPAVGWGLGGGEVTVANHNPT